MATGRYKLSDSGVYYDPLDQGPDQASPDQIQQFKQLQASAAPSAPDYGGNNPGGGVGGSWGGGQGYAPSGQYQLTPDKQLQDHYNGDPSVSAPSSPIANTGVAGGATPPAQMPQAPQAAPTNYGSAPPGFDQAKWADPN